MLITKITPLFILKNSIKFLINLKSLIRGGRFIQLTPSFFTSQYLWDRYRKKYLNIKIRSYIDFLTLTQIYYQNDYGLEKIRKNKELMLYYKKIINEGKTPLIIDCGGNIGLASRFFSDDYPESKVILVEPDHMNILQAKINNDQFKIDFYEKAIGCRDEKGNVVDPGLGEWGYRVQTSAEGDTEIITVNSILAKYESDKYSPFLIKIDIEGFEANLFRENTEWIDKFPLLIIELHDWMLPGEANSSNFLKKIAQLNRDFEYHGENIFSISNKLS